MSKELAMLLFLLLLAYYGGRWSTREMWCVGGIVGVFMVWRSLQRTTASWLASGVTPEG